MDPSLVDLLKALGRPIDVGCTLIENLLSEPTKKLGGVIGDQISYWQWSNRLNIAEKAAAKLDRKGFSARQLPNDFAVPFLRDCGDAEHNDLQEWWADMLANATIDESFCRVSFVQTLHALSPVDVRVLDALVSLDDIDVKDRNEPICIATGLSNREITMSFHNLLHLGLFTSSGRKLNGFALDLLDACYPHPDRIAAFREKQVKMKNLVLMG